MRQATATLALACLASAALALPAPATAAPAGARPHVVTLTADTDEAAGVTRRLARRFALRVGHRYDSALAGFSADLTARQARTLARDPRVAAVERDIRFRAAATGGERLNREKPDKRGGSSKDGGSGTPAEIVPPGVTRIGAGVPVPAGAVAVLDTGIDLGHPELDAADGVNCIRPGTPAQDDNGHGTNVAGIAAARADGVGVVGVAPGARVYSVKVLDASAGGSLSSVLCGIDWVTENAARLDIGVANMSLGGVGHDDGACGAVSGDSQHAAICRSTAAGVTYVAAAGNAGAALETTAPAAYGEVLAVTAMTDTDGRAGGTGDRACVKRERDDASASYSNHAANGAPDRLLAAPGTCVASTGLDSGTVTYNGTSQAAPHVAGVVARCLGTAQAPGVCAGLAPAAVIARISEDSARLATRENGFLGDPLRPLAGRAYGPLVTAAPY